MTATNTVSNVKPLLFQRQRKGKPKQVHIYMNEKDQERLSALVERIEPHTQTQVFRGALQLLEALAAEYDAGSQFLIKRKGKKIEPYAIFGEE